MYDEENDRLKEVLLKTEGQLIKHIFPKIIDQINDSDIILGGAKVFLLSMIQNIKMV